MSRIVSSVTVVGTLAAFFGHETHSDASGLSVRRSASRLPGQIFLAGHEEVDDVHVRGNGTFENHALRDRCEQA